MSEDPRFDEALRRWAARPARTTPAEARERLARRLEDERPSNAPRWGALAAALVVAVLGAWWLLPSSSPPPAPVAATAVADLPLLDGSTALIYLDANTPLYISLTPPGGKDQQR